MRHFQKYRHFLFITTWKGKLPLAANLLYRNMEYTRCSNAIFAWMDEIPKNISIEEKNLTWRQHFQISSFFLETFCMFQHFQIFEFLLPWCTTKKCKILSVCLFLTDYHELWYASYFGAYNVGKQCESEMVSLRVCPNYKNIVFQNHHIRNTTWHFNDKYSSNIIISIAWA